MHHPDNISRNLPSGQAPMGPELINARLVYNSARELLPSPQTQLRIGRFLLVSESANIKNKFPVSLLPPPDYALETLGLGATLACAQEIPLFVGMDSALGCFLPCPIPCQTSSILGHPCLGFLINPKSPRERERQDALLEDQHHGQASLSLSSLPTWTF